MASTEKFVLYTSKVSQWAMVPHLGLVEKGFGEEEYETREINILVAENFDVEYLKINPNGTVPSLTAPSLDRPLTESAEVLEYLDRSHPNSGPKLTPTQKNTQEKVQQLINLVHSDAVGTSLILLMARDKAEFQEKQSSVWKDFIGTRQKVLEENQTKYPEHEFYRGKSVENGTVNGLYTSEVGPDHEAFFAHSREGYRAFAKGVEELNSLLVLPYAAGEEVTLADLNIVPWLAHAMWAAGATEVGDFGPLEEVIQKTVPGFEVGGKIRQWWSKFGERESFKKVYPVLH